VVKIEIAPPQSVLIALLARCHGRSSRRYAAILPRNDARTSEKMWLKP
jgi:hypothetical protein